MVLTKDILSDNSKIVKAFQDVVDMYGGQIKVATIDHIASTPAVVFPVKELAAMFHAKHIPVVVDGAYHQHF